MPVNDRRRHARVFFKSPVRGAVGGSRVLVLDISPIGLGVAHENPLPPPGGVCRVELPSDLGPIKLDCTIVRTVKRSLGDAARAIFHSGLEVLAADRQSQARLQTITTTVK
jgi:PilZ domain